MVSSKIILVAVLVVAVTALPPHRVSDERISAVSRFAKGISDKCEGARIALNNLALIIEKEDRVIDIDSALYTLFSWIAAVTNIGNTWIDGVGTHYGNMLQAFIKMGLCHEPTTKRLDIELNGFVPQLCKKDYGSEWNFRQYECDKHTAEEAIKWYNLEHIIATFEELRKNYNNGAGFKDEAEKLVFEAMFTSAQIIAKNPEQWLPEDMAVLINNLITTLGVYGSSYKDTNFGDAIIDEFATDYGVLLFLVDIEVDLKAIIEDVKKSYKTVQRNTFNGAFLEYQDDGFDNDGSQKGVVAHVGLLVV